MLIRINVNTPNLCVRNVVMGLERGNLVLFFQAMLCEIVNPVNTLYHSFVVTAAISTLNLCLDSVSLELMTALRFLINMYPI